MAINQGTTKQAHHSPSSSNASNRSSFSSVQKSSSSESDILQRKQGSTTMPRNTCSQVHNIEALKGWHSFQAAQNAFENRTARIAADSQEPQRPNYESMAAHGCQSPSNPDTTRDKWRTWNEVSIYAFAIPNIVTARDLFKNFSRHGEVRFLKIHPPAHGQGSAAATVIMRLVQSSWSNHTLTDD